MTGILRIPQKIPENQREWEQFTRQLNQLIEQDAPQHYSIDATMARASDQRLLPLVNSSNKLSTQSVQPVTASDAGANATIAIAAHSVQFGFGPVSYGSGSVTGLAYSTLYYVYVDDPDYEGGAVTYLATTNALLVTAGNGRYYVGKVTTPAAAGPPTGGGWGGGGGGGGSQIPAVLLGAVMTGEFAMHLFGSLL
jgi:hypothetical protein